MNKMKSKRKPTIGYCCFCSRTVELNYSLDCTYVDTRRRNRIFFHKSCYYDYIESYKNDNKQ